MIHRSLAILGALSLLAVGSAFAEDVERDIDDGAEGGCVSNRKVYPEDAELCQEGTLARCKSGAWGTIGACKEAPGPEPVSQGGNTVESED